MERNRTLTIRTPPTRPQYPVQTSRNIWPRVDHRKVPQGQLRTTEDAVTADKVHDRGTVEFESTANTAGVCARDHDV